MQINVLKQRQLVDFSSTRRSPRIRLQVPVFLRGTDVSGVEFIELTKTLNIASSSLVPSETPPIVARVLRQESAGEMRLFGLEFLRTLE